MGLIRKPYNFLAIIFLLTSSANVSADDSGCLIKVGTGLKLDEKCSCLQSKSCAKIKTFKADENFLNQADSRSRPLFNSNEKSKMRESMKVYDQIVKLRLAGKSNSDEIKSLYKSLDTLNRDLRSSFLKTQSKYLDNSKTVYKKNLKKLKEQKLSTLKLVTDNLDKKIDAIPVKNFIEAKNPPPVEKARQEEVQQVYIASPRSNHEYNFDNEAILKNLKPERLQREETDTLFEIITKTYMRSAYPQLLDRSPSIVPAK